MRAVLVVAKPYDAEIVRRALAGGGFEVRVSDGPDGLVAEVEEGRPEVVVLSLRLAGVDPLEILRSVRGGPHGREVPLLLVGDVGGQVATREDAVRLGANELVLRPLDPAGLLTKVREVAGNGEGGARDAGPRLRAKHAQVREGDYFTVLDLPREATVEQIREAHARLRQEFGTAQFPAEEAARAQEIVEVLDEALSVLDDDVLREAYRESLDR